MSKNNDAGVAAAIFVPLSVMLAVYVWSMAGIGKSRDVETTKRYAACVAHHSPKECKDE